MSSASTRGSICGVCEDPHPQHRHYTVTIKEHKEVVGRLTARGNLTNATDATAVMSKKRATLVAAWAQGRGVKAKVKPQR